MFVRLPASVLVCVCARLNITTERRFVGTTGWMKVGCEGRRGGLICEEREVEGVRCEGGGEDKRRKKRLDITSKKEVVACENEERGNIKKEEGEICNISEDVIKERFKGGGEGAGEMKERRK